ncbi:MAG: protein kinase domain-containing protein [Carbonactinosporaceae bacterium]
MHGEPLAGRYRLLESLGRGGMGEVWRAEDLALTRPVAVKLMLPAGAADAGLVERFHREARAAARLSHPNLVTLYDFGAAGGAPFLVMELVHGRSLADVLREQGPLPPDRVAGIGAQVARALATAHAAGVVHRDVKPANLLLTDSGMVKVTDFGIARFVDAAVTALTQTGAVFGTGPYLSPEQALGRPAEAASDLYSLGCVLYELLVGHPPFTAQNAATLLYHHVHDQPLPPSQLRADVPAGLEQLILGLLAKEPGERPGSGATQAAEIAEALQSLASGGTVTTPLSTFGESHASRATQVLGTHRSESVHRAPSSRLRDPRLLFAAGALIALAVAAMLLTGNEAPGAGSAAPDPDRRAATTSPTRTQPPEATPTRLANTPEEPVAAPKRPRSPEALLVALGDRLDAQTASGDLDPKRAEKVQKHVDEASKKLGEGKPDDAAKEVEAVAKELEGAREKGEWRTDGQTIRLLRQLGSALPRGD